MEAAAQEVIICGILDKKNTSHDVRANVGDDPLAIAGHARNKKGLAVFG